MMLLFQSTIQSGSVVHSNAGTKLVNTKHKRCILLLKSTLAFIPSLIQFIIRSEGELCKIALPYFSLMSIP